MKKLLLFSGRSFCLALIFAAPVAAEWKSVGNFSADAAQVNSIVFRDQQNIVTLTVLAPDLIHVRMVAGPTPEPDFSYAVAKTDWAPAKVEFAGDKELRLIRTPELEVRAQLSPFRLAFYDRSGRLISRDADHLGMAREGDRVRCWKSMPPDEHYFGLGEKPQRIEIDGKTLLELESSPALDAATEGWAYDGISNVVWLKTHDEGKALTAQIQ